MRLKTSFTFLFLVTISFELKAFSKSKGMANLSLGQGVSRPSSISPLVGGDNPYGLTEQGGIRSTVTADRRTENLVNSLGGSMGIGYGNGSFGLGVAVKAQSQDDGVSHGISVFGVSGFIKSINLGVGLYSYTSNAVQIDNSRTIGFLWNPKGKHRAGAMINHIELENVRSYKGGYSFVHKEFDVGVDFTFFENGPEESNMVMTPGFVFKHKKFAFSFSKSIALMNDTFSDDLILNNYTDDVGFGLGYQLSKKSYIALYRNYINTYSLILSMAI